MGGSSPPPPPSLRQSLGPHVSNSGPLPARLEPRLLPPAHRVCHCFCVRRWLECDLPSKLLSFLQPGNRDEVRINIAQFLHDIVENQALRPITGALFTPDFLDQFIDMLIADQQREPCSVLYCAGVKVLKAAFKDDGLKAENEVKSAGT